MNTNIPKVSVVIPVYNSAQYLRECLDSILKQSLKEIEIICVDDASTDSSIDIIKQYMASDDRLQLLRLEDNCGAGVARNHGMAQAKGEYIIFLDADDFFAEEMLSKSYSRAIETDSDIVLFQGEKYSERTKRFSSISYLQLKWLKDVDVFSRKDFPDKIMEISNPAAWDKLYRRGFLAEKELQFQALPNSNDLRFTMLSMCFAQRISYVPDVLICYRADNPGSTQGRKKETGNTCFLSALKSLYDHLKESGLYPEVEQSFRELATSICVVTLNATNDFSTRLQLLKEMHGDFFPYTNLLSFPMEKMRHKTEYARLLATPFILELQEKLTAGIPEISSLQENNRYPGEPRVSIIIPIYNVEKYLEECLHSALAQSMKEIEVLCIDDGSSDRSLAIAELIAQEDSRIHVLRQEHRGQSVARNLGVSMAKGDYVLFLDSDDYLESDTVRTLYERAIADHLDIVFFDCEVFSDDDPGTDDVMQNESRYFERNHPYPDVYTGEELLYQMYHNKDYNCSPCLQLIRKEHFIDNNLWFVPGILHEDEPFTFRNFLTAKRVGYCDHRYYHRRVRSNSVMTSRRGYQNAIGCWKGSMFMWDAFLHTEVPEEHELELSEMIMKLQKKTRKIYETLSPAEQYAYFALPDPERIRFEADVMTYVRQNTEKMQIKQKMDNQRKCLTKTQKQLNGIQASNSYTIGRFITYVPRKVKGGICCYREHGLKYTGQRMIKKSMRVLCML